MKFIKGDIIKFKVNGKHIPERYYAESHIDDSFIKHGRVHFKENRGEVIDYSNDYVVVRYFSDIDESVQLGFRECDLELFERRKLNFRISYVDNKDEIVNIEMEGDSKEQVTSELKNLKRINYIIEG